MTTKQKYGNLQKCPLLKDFPEKDLYTLAGIAKEKIFPSFTNILSQHEPAREVLFIYRGLVSIYISNAEGKIIPIRTKEAPYIVGELNIVDDKANTTIKTLQQTYALVLPVMYLRKLLVASPLFARNLLSLTVEKLRIANKQTEHYFSTSLKYRTWTIIQGMADYFPNNEISLSQEELADIVGATRAKVGEALQELKDEKLLSIFYKKIQVKQIVPQGADA